MNWKSMEKDLIDFLKSFKKNGIEFKNSHQAIIGFPLSDGFRSDGMLACKDILIAIEVECGQTHPDTNTGKYWLLYNKYQQYNKIILFHIFTPDFDSYGKRKELAEFYIEQMKKNIPIEYIQFDFRKENNYNQKLEEIKNIINEKVKKEFDLIQ